MSYTPFVPSTQIEKYFAWLSAIPHGSFNEYALSCAVREIAEKAGLWTYQDEVSNLLVRRPATPGCEHKAPLILQAHMDMVCAKIPGSRHDFLTDPLKLYVDEEGWLHALETSLGADDGIGVAYMMDLMLRDDIPLPELELLFTVQEEAGMGGARLFDYSLLRGRRMIGLDCGGEHFTAVSSCGSRRMIFTLPLEKADVCGRQVRLSVEGLTGGHSASDIVDARGNAIKLLAHILSALEKTGAALIRAEGGEADNAIPRSASAVLCIPDEQYAQAQKIVDEYTRSYTKSYRLTDPKLTVTLNPENGEAKAAYSLHGIRMLVALRDGVFARDPEHPPRSALSSNMGVLAIRDGILTVRSMIRSTTEEWKELLSEQLIAAAEAYGARYTVDSDYTGWEYDPDSALRRLYFETVQDLFGHSMNEAFAAGGLEAGFFAGGVPGMDIIEMQCTMTGLHSPSEKMELVSFNRMYELLVKLIERLP